MSVMEVEARGSEIQGHPWICREFLACLFPNDFGVLGTSEVQYRPFGNKGYGGSCVMKSLWVLG